MGDGHRLRDRGARARTHLDLRGRLRADRPQPRQDHPGGAGPRPEAHVRPEALPRGPARPDQQQQGQLSQADRGPVRDQGVDEGDGDEALAEHLRPQHDRKGVQEEGQGVPGRRAFLLFIGVCGRFYEKRMAAIGCE